MRHAILSALSALFDALRARLGPFLDLLDARYLPLIAVVAPQAYTVYAWLLTDGAPPWVAVMGGLGYESVYVGAVAWAARGAGWSAARLPAVTALVFSVAVSVAYYGPTRGALAVLHAGFPLVAYAYTVMMHAPAGSRPPGLWSTLVRRWTASDRDPDHVDQVDPPAVVQPVHHQLAGPPADLEAGQELVQVGRRVVTLDRLAEETGIAKSTLSRKVDKAAKGADHAG
jgi:hypothetical protein